MVGYGVFSPADLEKEVSHLPAAGTSVPFGIALSTMFVAGT